MQFSALQTEVYARGFAYLNDGGAGQTRTQRWINQSYLELSEEEEWPWLVATTTGAAPLTITDLRAVQSVVDTGQNKPLYPVDVRTLTERFVPITTAGAPRYYYIDQGTIVRTYPVGGTLSVVYWKVPAELVAGTDTPTVPQRFHELIVHGAVRLAYLDNDNKQGADIAEAERQAGLARMRQSLLWQDQFGTAMIEVGGASTDWGTFGGGW